MDSAVVDDSQVLINTQTGRYPMSLEDVREEVVQVSLPLKPGVVQLSRLGYEVVKQTQKPTDAVVVEGNPVKSEDGRYVQHWRAPNEEESEGILQLRKNEALRNLKRQYQHLTNVGFAFLLEGQRHHIPVTGHNRQYLLELRLLLSADNPPTDVLIPTKKTVYESVNGEHALSIVCNFFDFCNRLESAFLVLKKLTFDAKEVELIPAIYDVALEQEMSRV